MQKLPRALAVLGLSLLAACTCQRARRTAENASETVRRAREDALRAFQTPPAEHVPDSVRDGVALGPMLSGTLRCLPEPESLDARFLESLDSCAVDCGRVRSDRRGLDFIESFRMDDCLGIDGLKIGPGKVILRIELGDGWLIDIGYGRHVRGTSRTCDASAGAPMALAQNRHRLPSMRSFGFSITCRLP